MDKQTSNLKSTFDSYTMVDCLQINYLFWLPLPKTLFWKMYTRLGEKEEEDEGLRMQVGVTSTPV